MTDLVRSLPIYYRLSILSNQILFSIIIRCDEWYASLF